jgi:hypothetical protein
MTKMFTKMRALCVLVTTAMTFGQMAFGETPPPDQSDTSTGGGGSTDPGGAGNGGGDQKTGAGPAWTPPACTSSAVPDWYPAGPSVSGLTTQVKRDLFFVQEFFDGNLRFAHSYAVADPLISTRYPSSMEYWNDNENSLTFACHW